jgi:hypothetical protein
MHIMTVWRLTPSVRHWEQPSSEHTRRQSQTARYCRQSASTCRIQLTRLWHKQASWRRTAQSEERAAKSLSGCASVRLFILHDYDRACKLISTGIMKSLRGSARERYSEFRIVFLIAVFMAQCLINKTYVQLHRYICCFCRSIVGWGNML